MRHIRTRRRYKVILLFLLLLCTTLFVESRIEALLPELKTFAELRVERALGGKIKLGIGSVDGGLLQPIVLNGVRIEQAKGSVIFQSLVINNIRTNYRVWDLLKMKGTPTVNDLLEKNSAIYVNFSLRNGDITGFAGIEGTLEESKVSGYVRLFGKEKVEFIGSVKGDRFDLSIRPKNGTLKLAGSVSDTGELDIDFKADHMKFHDINIFCDGHIRNRRIPGSRQAIPGDAPKLGGAAGSAAPAGVGGAAGSAAPAGVGGAAGEFETRELVVNNIRFLDVKTTYTVSDGVLTVPDLKLGENIRLTGTVGLKRPNIIDLTLVTDNVNLSQILKKAGMAGSSSVLTGTMNGKFVFKGPIEKVRVDARFEMRKGTMATLNFDYLTANLRGDLPYLKIEDTRVTRESGYFILAGELDMRRVGKAALFQDIRLVTDDGAITWDDWSAENRQGVKETNMTKNLTSDFGFTYKKFTSDQRIDESVRDNDELKLQYKLSPTESLGVMLGQDKDFFGFEHKDKF